MNPDNPDPLSIQIATNVSRISMEIDTAQKRKSIDMDEVQEEARVLLGTELHLMPLDKLQVELDTDLVKGLTSNERKLRLSRDGLNTLTETKGTNPIIRLLLTQADLFAILLWVAAIVSFAMYGVTISQGHGEVHNLWLGIALAFVNVFSGLLTFFQESKSNSIMKGFKSLIPQECLVFEDGIIKTVATDTLIVGDIVKIKVGQKCPADLRLLSQNQLKIDLSSFNGESEPAARKIENTETNILRSANIIYFTSNIMQGDGIGIVIFTGDNTVIGQQAKNVTSTKQPPTPIQIEVQRFVKYISILAISLGIIFFGLGIALKIPPIDAFVFGVGIIVANVPEGLSLTITVALALAAKRLSQQKVLVKELKSVETLGSISVICSDKTGTITMNQMTASHTFCNNKVVKHQIQHAMGSFLFGTELPLEFIKVLSLNSKCDMDQTDQETNNLKVRLMGDASEQGIMRFMNSWLTQNQESIKNDKYPILTYRDQYPKKYEIPFSSVYKFQLSIHETEDKKALITLKGAPERIMDICDKVFIDGQVVDFTDDHKNTTLEAYNEIASFGERVLGCAYSIEELQTEEYTLDADDVKNMKFVFVGLVSLVDPPKENVTRSVSECYEASIGITMITGDHHLTATAIAKEVGILNDSIDYYTDANVLLRIKTSNELSEAQAQEQNLDDEDMQAKTCIKKKAEKNPRLISEKEIKYLPQMQKEFIPSSPAKGAVMTGNVLEVLTNVQIKYMLSQYQQIVFARTTPEQKLTITQCYQSLGRIVAVSGDGLNDAPALKAADIGVAMASGSEVAREAGNIILMNDSFATIVDGIKEGRLIFENLKKAMSYTITSAVPQITPFLLFVIFGFPNAMSSILILLIDVVTDVWPAFALGYEKPESDIMKRPPRNKEKDRLLDGHLVFFAYGQIGCLQALALLATFMLTVRREIFKYYPCAKYSGNIFVSLSHDDFPSVTLTKLLTDAQSSCAFNGTYPKNVTDQAGLAKFIFEVGQTASFVSVVVMQFVDAIISRTRINSMFTQGIISNPMLLLGLLFQIIICCFFTYVPFCHTAFGTKAVDGLAWTYCLPFAVLMFIYDECRKFLLRKYGKQSKFYKIMHW
ncbi:Sodium/potassium-transporting ATPase alpha chain [Spironucleus salmonicida]|uniref:Sodium/potassium-transporting ATPase alpha chain n=1 Tax=Spironucleus salmonicida TaxID=348837 RepID=V6LS57_9EUKA|nr:Sodium/potassium-transporting ATPase alpha chain [Spironucleus salmonicida]|eukprot:EST43614.1 Sodium/potassium-transporting ATPase alpha chain [Spironucleus salmonicida]